MKIAYIILDGAADGLHAPRKSLKEAAKPNIDYIASKSRCGLVHTVGRGIAPESDAATLSLLGYNPVKYYTGRGPLEALGVGLRLREGYEIALRANFATIDPSTYRIIDRRVGRNLTSSEARILASEIDNMNLAGGEGYARFKSTIGHRGVLIVGHRKRRINAMISNTDPAYERKGLISEALKSFEPVLRRAEPLEESEEARLAAELVNEFTDKAVRILDAHPVNRERVSRGLLPANAVLLRDAGDRLPDVRPIGEWTGFKWAAIAEMPVERGIARAVGMGVLEVIVEGKSKPELLKEEAGLLVEGLKQYEAVYAHLKGPDEPGHDGSLEGKVEAIEAIDEFFFPKIMELVEDGETAVIITSDHATPWHLKSHSDDPVPLAIYVPGVEGDGFSGFNEEECAKGSLGVLEGGYNILPTALDILKRVNS